MLQVGHGPARQRSPIPIERITGFWSVGPDGTIDRRSSLALGAPDADARLAFGKPGTYIVALETNGALSDLPALRFNDYLAAEGLTAAIERRRSQGAESRAGRELYSRRAKAVVAIAPDGANPSSSSSVTTPVGLSLEIVPDSDPSNLEPGDPLGVHVLYNGAPLAGALVKLTDLAADDRPFATAVTDNDGGAPFTVPRAGAWLLNVVWSEPLAPNRKAEFLTTFSSLAFAVWADAR